MVGLVFSAEIVFICALWAEIVKPKKLKQKDVVFLFCASGNGQEVQ